MDGTCNNLKNPNWGARNIRYFWERPPTYDDGKRWIYRFLLTDAVEFDRMKILENLSTVDTKLVSLTPISTHIFYFCKI